MSLAKPLNLAMRASAFLWALLVMALIGNMIAMQNGGSPAIVNYAMFCAVFAMLCLLYLIPATLKEAFAINPIIPLALDVLLAIFWFCGAVAMAAYLGAQSCTNRNYTSNNFVINGNGGLEKRCREAQASTAFLWFGFASFAASAVLSALGGIGGSGVNMRGGAGGIRRGPAMSQV
ncbi:hypothetical protein MBLNU230_g4026t1 [Neophaeotheca triangularis]